MDEAYCNLKRKLEELGYNYNLTPDAVPLVECIVADLLQTTRSLQHYMNLSKEALIQRDSLIMETEPYKCDNAKLITENNELHKEIIQLKEDNNRLTKESKRKIKWLSEELSKKDTIISKLQHDIKDLSLRTLCTSTQSSRNRSRRKDEENDVVSKLCMCNNQKKFDTGKEENLELSKNITLLKQENEALNDEILLLKDQVEHRDSEIVRLNMLLEGGRPITAVYKDFNTSEHVGVDISISNKLKQILQENQYLKKEIESGLEKQHEAMLRALTLADKNKILKEELQKVDKLALQVEEDCNKKLATATNEISCLQGRIQNFTRKNSELEKELFKFQKQELTLNSKESLNVALKEKDILQKEVRDLIDINKTLQDKIVSLCQFNKCYHETISMECQNNKTGSKCLQKDELHKLLKDERLKYEKYIKEIQEKLSETLNIFNKQIPDGNEKSSKHHHFQNNDFIRDLHNKLCESEQKILMLKKDNDELKLKSIQQESCNKETYKDIIKHLNDENAQLTSENISLSQRISKYNLLNSAHHNRDEGNSELFKLREKNNWLKKELECLSRDKQEYQVRYKESMELVDKLKRDLALKQKEIEHLEEENCSYKFTNRTGKASTEQLKEECKFLKEQIKKMQTDVIKEKTLSNQIKNIQIETERNTSEIQNELLSVQKKLSLSKDNISDLEKKCRELQSEISTLKVDKLNLIENIKLIDKERDKLVIELDNKTECISNQEQKQKSQAFEINKLENEIAELKQKINVHKSAEHKITDYESQIMYLNGEILRLTHQNDTAIMENKRLINTLADVNCAQNLSKLELDKSKKEVDNLKQQLQHYVAEVRRVEALLSQIEAERADMLEQFTSLSVEANILENTNNSLENETASKSVQLQTYISKIQSLESKLLDKENELDSQGAHIAKYKCKIATLENEIKLITDEKKLCEQNVSYLKQMCNDFQKEQSHKIIELKDTDSELKLYENKIKSLMNSKSRLEKENKDVLDKLNTTEKLLSNTRREIVDLKLALQDATSETKSLQDCVSRLSRNEPEFHENTLTEYINDDINIPLTLEETIGEVINEEDDDEDLHSELMLHKPYFTPTFHSHGSTI